MTFGKVQQHGKIKGLGGASKDAGFAPGGGRGLSDGSFEGGGTGGSGATIRGEESAFGQAVESAGMQRFDGDNIEGITLGWIENDRVELAGAALGEEGRDVGIDCFNETQILLRLCANGFNTGQRAVDGDHVLRTSSGGLESKGTAVSIAVKHSAAFAEATHERVLLTLIEEETGLLRIEPVEAIGQAIDLNPTSLQVLAAQSARRAFETQRGTLGKVIKKDDLLRLAGFF